MHLLKGRAKRFASCGTLALVGASLAPASAQVPDCEVLIVAAESSSRIADVQAGLQSTGRFSVVDSFDATAGTPSLALLGQYDAVLTWSNATWNDGILYGDTLADHVDAGGAVVVAWAAIGDIGAPGQSAFLNIRGRWEAQGYDVITSQGFANTPSQLGVVQQPGHPVMAGVSSLSAKLMDGMTPSLATGAVLLAQWSNGGTVAAIDGSNPRRVDLGLWPVSKNASSNGWELAGDGWLLLGNALSFVANCPATIYCTAKPNSCGTLPAIDGTGNPSATLGSGYTVAATNTKALKAGLLLYTDSGPANLPFAGGTLCLNPMPLRRSVAVIDTTGTPILCNGTLAIDMNAFAVGALGGNPLPSLQVVGTRVNCQFWGRDTVTTGALLSNALEYFVGP